MIFYNKLNKWISTLSKKINQNPTKNIPILFISLILIFIMAKEIGGRFGVFSLIGYIFLCFYKLADIIDDIRRTLAWGVGYIIVTIAFSMVPTFIFPLLGSITLVSIFSILIIGYIIIHFVLMGEKMKRY